MRARWLLSTAAALSATLLFSTGALAAPGAERGMGTRFGSAAAGPGSDLYSHGGGVETAPAVFISYWGPEWASGFSTGGYSSRTAQSYVNGFFGSVGGSGWINSTTQYCQGVPAGTVTCAGVPLAQHVGNPSGQLQGTPWNDRTAVPRRPTSNDLALAAQRAVAHFGYSATATYMIFTPSGKSTSGFGTTYCAWHGQTSYGGRPVAFANTPYQPDAGAGCGMNYVNRGNDAFGHGYFDGFSIVAGHEYAEALTDPYTNTAQGWLDRSGNENGDKCAWGRGPGPDSASANVTLGSTYYAVQPLWSNAANGGAGGCVMRF